MFLPLNMGYFMEGCQVGISWMMIFLISLDWSKAIFHRKIFGFRLRCSQQNQSIDSHNSCCSAARFWWLNLPLDSNFDGSNHVKSTYLLVYGNWVWWITMIIPKMHRYSWPVGQEHPNIPNQPTNMGFPIIPTDYNWLSYCSEGWLNHQPDKAFEEFIMESCASNLAIHTRAGAPCACWAAPRVWLHSRRRLWHQRPEVPDGRCGNWGAVWRVEDGESNQVIYYYCYSYYYLLCSLI